MQHFSSLDMHLMRDMQPHSNTAQLEGSAIQIDCPTAEYIRNLTVQNGALSMVCSNSTASSDTMNVMLGWKIVRQATGAGYFKSL